jgi:hypothetical protein
MSSLLGQTTSFAYLEFAASRLQACGHEAEIVTSSATGQMALRVDGVEQSIQDIARMLAPGASGLRAGASLPV